MTTYNWTTFANGGTVPVSGDWMTAANWTSTATPATAPNDPTADVIIDSATALTSGYTVTIGAGESVSVSTLTMNDTPTDLSGTNNIQGYFAAELELDGTLTFAPGSAGALAGALQTIVHVSNGDNAEIVNGGTLNGFIQVEGNLLITGTNGVYITNYLQALAGTVTVDSSSIAEISGNTLFDGIFEAKGPGAVVNLGGSLEGLVVNIGTIEGPPLNPGGWTELTFNDPSAQINEWNGTGYVSVETTLTDIKGGGTVDVLVGRNYTTTNTLTIEGAGTGSSPGMFNLQAGTVTTAGIDIAGGIVQGFATIAGGVVNDGTLTALGGTLDLTGGLTGTGLVNFDHDSQAGTLSATGATLEVNAVSAGQTIVMNGDDTLQLDTPAAFAGTIEAKAGDKIVLQGVTGTSAVLTNGTLVVSDGTTIVDTLNVSGSYTGDSFSVSGSTIQISGTVAASGSTLSPDILFQNQDGQMAQWTVSGSTIASGTYIGPNPGPSWFAMGTGAFYTGDSSDIVWQNEDGAVSVWQVQGTNLLGGAVVAANPGPTWHIKGTGDLYGDGNSDILWQNDNGSVALWDMSGSTIVQAAVVAANPGPSWHVKGTGDFYGDGHTDILWQNDNGSVALWDMNGTSIVQAAIVAANPGSTWHIEGTGDFYGDGNTDILWQNDNGSVALWDMKGSTIVQAGIVAANPGPTWHVEAVGDFNNDGKADIAWQNDNGSIAVWEMSGTNIVSAAVLANPGTSWSVVGGENMRFVSSGAAGETLSAASATPDEFVFTNAAAGSHAITGFNVTQDVVELSSALFGSFGDVQAATSATAGGALINLGNSASLFLAGVDPGSLHASNFALG